MKFRIRKRINSSGYQWYYIQQLFLGFYWGLPTCGKLQQAFFTSSGGRMSYKEFQSLKEAQDALDEVINIKPSDTIVQVVSA